jgi:transposase
MPRRPFHRDQPVLVPYAFDEWIPADHWVRFVDAFIAELRREDWAELGIARLGAELGAPSYHPELLLRVWVAGFMGGLRSARQLETACREQVPFRWLTANQQPDHNTLWRFYAAHREKMRHLLTVTVQTAVAADLVDLAVMAVDGTKVSANVARVGLRDEATLRDLLARTEGAITELEAQNARSDVAPSPRLPGSLRAQQALRERVSAALTAVTDAGKAQASPTDPEAVVLPTRHGWVVGYNAQAAVVATHPVDPRPTAARDANDEPADDPPDGPAVPPADGTAVAGAQRARSARGGLFMVATDVVAQAADHELLVPLLDAAVRTLGRAPARVLADGGYHSGPTLTACATREQIVIMPEAQASQLPKPYHKDRFVYTEETDTYTCPEGQTLRHIGTVHRIDRPPVERYGVADPKWCQTCPVMAQCTQNHRQGRTLEVTHDEAAIRAHRVWMTTEAARAWARVRKTLPEPVFGILKEQRGLHRFWLRGLAAVRAEWSLIATGFNLRTLARAWQRGYPPLQQLARGG